MSKAFNLQLTLEHTRRPFFNRCVLTVCLGEARANIMQSASCTRGLVLQNNVFCKTKVARFCASVLKNLRHFKTSTTFVNARRNSELIFRFANFDGGSGLNVGSGTMGRVQLARVWRIRTQLFRRSITGCPRHQTIVHHGKVIGERLILNQ